MASDLPLDGPKSPVRIPSVGKGRVPAPLDADNSETLLAELDSLLERMMALPVNHLDEEQRVPQYNPDPPPHVAVITVTEALPEMASSAPPPAVTNTSDDLYVQAILHEKPPEQPPPSRPPEPVAVWSAPALEAEKPKPEEPAQPVSAPAPPPRISVPEPEPAAWMQPIFWVNRAFDHCTVPMGAAGRWLRQPRGRTLLGWAGLLMLGAVGGLALCDCLGWTW